MIRVTPLVILALLTQLSVSEPEISPSSKLIDINEGGSYTIQFIENNTTDIRQCFYLSETISGSFDVVKPETNDTTAIRTSARSNTIVEYGKSGLCRIDVKDVDGDSPKSWTLIAYDSKSDKNVSAEIAVNFYFNINLLQSRVVVTETGSFIQHLSPTATLQFTKCELSFENTTLNLSASRSVTTKEDSHILKRIFSLGREKCGFKLINVTSDDPREFTMIATDSNNTIYRATFIVTILTQGSKYKSQEVTLGEMVYISCGLQLPDDQYFCDLYDPKGNLVQSEQRCSLTLDMVTVNHIGKWKCSIGVPYLMETPVYEVELFQKENENVTTWVEETTDYVNIGCRFNNYDRLTSGSSYCRMMAPNQQIFKIQSGAASSRYTTVTTDLTAYTCGLEIEKPLEEFERGVWKCEIYLINDMVGGFLRVGINENVTVDYEKHQQKTIRLDEAFQIECKVPYSTKYCHIKAPDGTIYPTNNVYKTYLGECSLSVSKSVESHNGTWTCSFARETGYPDEEIYVEVTIADVLIYYEEVEVTRGNDAELYCNSGGISLQYCRFISPLGVAYHLENHESDTGISYTGAGLSKGECGIKVSNVNSSHQGNWTCITRLGYNFRQNEISAVIHLEVADNSSTATAVAASLGSIGGVLLVVSGYVVYKIRQRRKNRSDVATAPVGFLQRASVRSTGSGSSNSSGTVIIPAEANYNTVNNSNE